MNALARPPVLLLLLLAGCQTPYSEPDLHELDRRVVSGRGIRVTGVRPDHETILEGSRFLWIHRTDGSRGPEEDKRPMPEKVALELARKAFEEQLAAAGFSLAGPNDPADYLLEAELREVELRTEVSSKAGPDGRRAAVAEVRFLLRRASDSTLLATGAQRAWTVFSGADIEIDDSGGRSFQATDPEPRHYALRAALFQFLETAPLTSP